jgi:hypothetical protein
MSGDNWKTLRVPPEAYDEAKAQKEQHDRTWGEQLVRPDGDSADAVDAPDAEAIAEAFRQAFPYDEVAAQTASKTADELEGRMR